LSATSTETELPGQNPMEEGLRNPGETSELR